MSSVIGLGGGVPEWDLADRLHKSLRHAGLKPGGMAEYLEVHRNTVGNYLRGVIEPDGRTLKLWALRCGVGIEWLRSGDATGPGPGPGASVQYPPWDSNPEPAGYGPRERRTLELVAA